MKNLFCKLGFHREDKMGYVQVVKTHKNGKQYRRNHSYCSRCGKRLGLLNLRRRG